jgi:hypothetical protein
MSYGRNLRITLALSVVATAVTFAPSAAQSAVCNEASVGQRGDYVVTGPTVDPNPPARFTTDLRPLANGGSQGLDNAAERSPALSQCGEPSTPSGGGAS